MVLSCRCARRADRYRQKKQRFAFAPAQILVVDSHVQRAIRYDQTQMAGYEPLGDARMARNMGARLQNREKAAVEAGDLPELG